mmetsp:Transcript_42465/g.101013  ORF Transcript_42465/g.101013 Transcript_42465/m.101013 type:complete len:665 (+) Transcript_42465:71-2065(+)
MGAQRAGGWSALGLVVILGWVGGATAVFDLSEIPMMGCAADGLCDVVMTDGRRIETPQDGVRLRLPQNNHRPSKKDPAVTYVSFHIIYNSSIPNMALGPITYGAHLEHTSRSTSQGGVCPAGVPSSPIFGLASCGLCIGCGEATGASSATSALLAGSGVQSTLVTVGLKSDVWGTNVTLSNSTADNMICFHAVRAGEAGPKRCVNIIGVRAPDSPQVYRDGVLLAPSVDDVMIMAGNRQDVGGAVGTMLSLDIIAHGNSEEAIEIGLKNMGSELLAELPGQAWQGPTVCVATGHAGAPCPNWLWGRRLTYSPSQQEIGKVYSIRFQASNAGPAAGMFRPEPAPAGVACSLEEGVCPSAHGVPSFTGVVTVRVQSHVPHFKSFNDETTRLLTNDQNAVPVSPPRFLVKSPFQESAALDPPPLVYETIEGYINCPVVQFGLSAIKSGATLANRDAALTLSLVGRNAQVLRDMQIRISETTLFSKVREAPMGVDNPPEGDLEYYAHLTIAWDPPLEAAGRSYDVCIRAQDATSYADQCVTIEIKRCFYCTLPSDTLHSIARAYNSNWLQIWSANYENMGADYEIRGNAWTDTKNPNELKAGTVLRLGPIYRTRFDTSLAALAKEFQTTEASLRLGNPDLDPNSTLIAAMQEVCVLPDTCTQETEDWF